MAVSVLALLGRLRNRELSATSTLVGVLAVGFFAPHKGPGPNTETRTSEHQVVESPSVGHLRVDLGFLN
jgi:hypothetical protein